jgi:CBS domain-containing protein
MGADMNVGEICSRVVAVAESGTPVQEAAKRMRDHHIGALVVTEGGAEARRPIGILTDRDLVVEVVAAGVDYRTLTVGDIMSERPATTKESASLFEVIAQMRGGGVRRLVVVDAKGHLLGIVAMDDLIPVLAEEMSALAQAIRMEQRRETQRRP